MGKLNATCTAPTTGAEMGSVMNPPRPRMNPDVMDSAMELWMMRHIFAGSHSGLLVR